MNFILRCSLVGLAAGAATAAVWVMIVIRTGSLFSSFALAIGVAVGFAMRVAATKGPSGREMRMSNANALGFIAILITAISIAGGKLAFFSGLIEQMFETTATWEALRATFLQSFAGVRGLYSLAAVVAAYCIVAFADRPARPAGF